MYVQAMREMRFMADFQHDVMLPGHFSRGGQGCHHWQLKACLDQDAHYGVASVRKVLYECGQATCNMCFESWVRLRAAAITKRIVASALMVNNKLLHDKTRQRAILHVVFAPPAKNQFMYASERGRKILRKAAMDALKRVSDVDGGCMIDHPYTFTEKLQTAKWDPHFHFIMTGWVDYDKVSEHCSDIEGKLQSELERNGEDGRFEVGVVSHLSTVYDSVNVYGVAQYLLSHAGVIVSDALSRKTNREHTVRWFGRMGYNNMKVWGGTAGQEEGQQRNDMLNAIGDVIKGGDVKNIRVVKTAYEDVRHADYELVGDFKDVGSAVGAIQASVKEDYLALAKSKSCSSPDLAQDEKSERAPDSIYQIRYDVLQERKKTDDDGVLRGQGIFYMKSKFQTMFFSHSDDELCTKCKRRMCLLWADHKEDLVLGIPENVTFWVDYSSADMKYVHEMRGDDVNMPAHPYYDKETGKLSFIFRVMSRPQLISEIRSRQIRKSILDTEWYDMERELRMQSMLGHRRWEVLKECTGVNPLYLESGFKG